MSVAVIGCGCWGKNLVRNLQQLGALEMVCDREEAGRVNAARLAQQCRVTGDLHDVWQSPCQAVVIATPAATHYEIARQALEAGKDVFVEKPLALKYDDGICLARRAERQSRILMVGHVLEYHPAIVRLRELIKDGELGLVRYIYSNRLSLGKVRREENILWSFAPHDIATILRLVGDLPLEVSAVGASYLQPNTPDVTISHLLFDNGVRAHIHVSWLHPFKEQRFVVIGSRKMVSFDDLNKKLVLYDQYVKIQDGEPLAVRSPGCEVPFDNAEPLQLECRAFLDAIATRRQPLSDANSAVRVLRVLQACQRSIMTNGERVTIPMEVLA